MKRNSSSECLEAGIVATNALPNSARLRHEQDPRALKVADLLLRSTWESDLRSIPADERPARSRRLRLPERVRVVMQPYATGVRSSRHQQVRYAYRGNPIQRAEGGDHHGQGRGTGSLNR